MKRFGSYMSAGDFLGLFFALCMVCLWVAAIGGWIWNIVKLVEYAVSHSEITLFVVLRVIGIFAAPLGAILGYF